MISAEARNWPAGTTTSRSFSVPQGGSDGLPKGTKWTEKILEILSRFFSENTHDLIVVGYIEQVGKNKERTKEIKMDKIEIGTVIEDSYGNPAVVLAINPDGTARTIMQVVGSDRGNVTYPPLIIRVVTGDRAEWAKKIAREEWTKKGYRQSTFR